MLSLNSYKRENKLDLFSQKIAKMDLANSKYILPVTEIVNHMFIFFAFLQYNLPFFTPSYLLFYQTDR